MKELENNDKDFELWILLDKTREAILQVRQNELNRYNLSTSQAAVLNIICRLGGQATTAQISRWMFRKPNSMTQLINRMENEGLVTRVKDLPQKNLVRIAPTQKGEQLYLKSVKKGYLHQVMKNLSDEQQQQMTLILETLRTKAHKKLRIYKMPLLPPLKK